MKFDKEIDWDDEKNQMLIDERGVSFEEVAIAVQNNRILRIVDGKAPKYKHQKIMVVPIEGYTYAVPYVEDDKKIFLKTIYASRALHKKYY